MIFNLPEFLMVMCDAPGAALIGINKGESYLLQENIVQEYPNCVYICLDEEKIYMQEEDRVDVPFFDNFERDILQHYAHLNPHLDYRIVGFNTNKTRPQIGRKKFKDVPTHEEKKSCLEILDIFKDTLLKK